MASHPHRLDGCLLNGGLLKSSPPGLPGTVMRMLAPITDSLGKEMGFHTVEMTHPQIVQNTADPAGLSRMFLCPSQAESALEWHANPNNYYNFINLINFTNGNRTDPSWGYDLATASSYIWNEYVLGFNDSYSRLRGRASQVRQPAKTFFAADGLEDQTAHSRFSEYPSNQFTPFTLFNGFPGPKGSLPNGPAITMADALSGTSVVGQTLAGWPTNFDLKRHQGKINIAFCDGHVETRSINPSDLSSVFIVAP